MNKIFKYITVAAAVLTVTASCNKEEDLLFDQSTAKRLSAASVAYAERLADSKAGWIMEYYATNDVAEYNSGEAASYMGFPIVTNFNADGSVLVSMNNGFSGDQSVTEDSREYTGNGYKEEKSLWEIIGDNGPVLTFNTYNQLFHTFSDPRSYYCDNLGWGNSSEGSQGVGVGGDYEFIMIDVPQGGKHIMLKGKKRGTYVRLTRLPEGTDPEAYLKDISDFQKSVFPKEAPNYCVLTVNGDKFKTNEMFSTIPNIYTYSGDELADESYHPYIITKRDDKYYLRFGQKFSYTYVNENDRTVDYGLQEMVYDEQKDCFYDENNASTTLEGPEPGLFFTEEVNAAQYWILNASSVMSDKFKATFNDLKTKMKSNGSYTLSSIQFCKFEGEPVLRVYYQNSSKKNVSAYYKMEMEVTADGVKLNIGEPINDSSLSVYNKVEALRDFLKMLSTDIKVEATGSRFFQKTIKFTIVTDPESSFVISHT